MEFQTDTLVKAKLLLQAKELGFSISGDSINSLEKENSSHDFSAVLDSKASILESSDIDQLTKLAEALYRSQDKQAVEVADRIASILGDDSRTEDVLPALWAVVFINIYFDNLSKAIEAIQLLKNAIEKIHFKPNQNNPYPYLTHRLWILNALAIISVKETDDCAKIALLKLLRDDRFIKIIHQNVDLYDFYIFAFCQLYVKNQTTLKCIRQDINRLADVEHTSMNDLVKGFYSLVVKCDTFSVDLNAIENYVSSHFLLIEVKKDILSAFEAIKKSIRQQVFEDLE